MSKSSATQDFVPIKEVRDGIVVLKDGSLRAVLLVSSTNFSLKSSDEQESIIYQFQNFLNALDFSVQISIQSRRLDIRPYLALLEERKKEQMSDLLKVQIKEYIEFVKSFTESTNIMKKSFFVIVPYSPVFSGIKKSTKGIILRRKKGGDDKENEAKKQNFKENLTQLEQRIDIVAQGLTRTGLRVARLGTEEVVELFYRTFNPGETSRSAHQTTVN